MTANRHSHFVIYIGINCIQKCFAMQQNKTAIGLIHLAAILAGWVNLLDTKEDYEHSM